MYNTTDTLIFLYVLEFVTYQELRRRKFVSSSGKTKNIN